MDNGFPPPNLLNVRTIEGALHLEHHLILRLSEQLVHLQPTVGIYRPALITRKGNLVINH